MLYIIGLGLDKKDITLKGIESIKKCKLVYIDDYTNVLPYSVADVEKIIGKKIKIANRKLVEESEEIINWAKMSNVALLVPGDPLVATTHIDLILRAKKKKIKVCVVHAPSIITSVAETGLQLYKFGKIVSIPCWQTSYKPESFYDVIKDNLKINAHTLLLIDIKLDVKKALEQLKEIALKRKNKSILGKDIIVCSMLGTDKSVIVIGKLDKLIKKKFMLPACIIVPANLHFIEEEALKKIKRI